MIAGPFVNSLILSGGGAVVTLALACAIAVAARRATGIGKVSLQAAAMGYAAPGAVIAMGALALFGVAREAGWIGRLGTTLALGRQRLPQMRPSTLITMWQTT